MLPKKFPQGKAAGVCYLSLTCHLVTRVIKRGTVPLLSLRTVVERVEQTVPVLQSSATLVIKQTNYMWVECIILTLRATSSSSSRMLSAPQGCPNKLPVLISPCEQIRFNRITANCYVRQFTEQTHVTSHIDAVYSCRLLRYTNIK